MNAYQNAQIAYDSMAEIDIEPDGGSDESDGDEPEAWMETIYELEDEDERR